MSIADKLSMIAENQKKVYEAGAKNEEIKMWEMLTANGNRRLYASVFRESNFTGYAFPRPIQPKGTSSHMFYSYAGTELPQNIDFSNMPANADISNMFGYARDITQIPDMNIPAMDTYNATFGYCYDLEEIEILRVHKDTVFKNAFVSCNNLKTIAINGEIGTNFDIHWCSQLSHDSLINDGSTGIINTLYDYASEGNTSSHILTIGTGNLNKLTATEKAIATQKGWTLA